MAEIIFATSKVYNVGTQTFGPFTIPVGVQHFRFVFDRTGLNAQPTTTVFKANMEISLDSGTTWLKGVGFSAMGGTYYHSANEGGGVMNEIFVESDLLGDPQSTKRRIRFNIEVLGASFKTSGKLEIN